ncbi:MAG TPA: sugar ABC transporter permease [Anaerolineales bacterium]|nr:sugar ABC transporter permease [Anaerolineales bacterium]
MSTWSGQRKFLTVLAFIGPTLIGILVFNIYPIIFNTYISFTDRNQFHPNPDCSVPLTDLLVPTCWAIFSENAPSGVGQPFTIQDPLFTNYSTLFGSFFTQEVLIAFVKVLICLLPLVIASRINKQMGRDIDRNIPRWVVTAGGWIAVLILGFILNGREAITLVANAGDFFVVNFRSILFVALSIPLFFLVGLTLALVLNVPHLPGRTFFRVALIVPWAASTVAIMMSLVWKFFFQEQGTINQVIRSLGGEGQLWLNDPVIAFGVIILANVWYSYPFFMVTILGALQSVPKELYEAAEVDGAGWWPRLFNITLPLLRPAVIPAVVLSAIGAGGFQMFGTAWAITAGGPSRGAGTPGATELVMVYAYKQVFQTSAYGKMGAFAVIMFILLFIATLYSLRVSRLTRGAFQ